MSHAAAVAPPTADRILRINWLTGIGELQDSAPTSPAFANPGLSKILPGLPALRGIDMDV
jgi:hypothetical protein